VDGGHEATLPGNGGDPGAVTDLVEGEVAGVVPRERGDAAHGEVGGVVEVVDDDGAEAREQELQHGVAADVPGPARHQHGPRPGGSRSRRRAAVRRLLHRHRSKAGSVRPSAAGGWKPSLLLLAPCRSSRRGSGRGACAEASERRAQVGGGRGGEE
jgi:hypothetical protein